MLAVRSMSWQQHGMEMMCSVNGMCSANQTWSVNGDECGPEGMQMECLNACEKGSESSCVRNI